MGFGRITKIYREQWVSAHVSVDRVRGWRQSDLRPRVGSFSSKNCKMFGMVYSTGSAKIMPSTRMCSWRCLVAYIGKLSANLADREDENMRVSGEMLEMERVG